MSIDPGRSSGAAAPPDRRDRLQRRDRARYLTPLPVFYEVTMAMEQHTYSFPKVTPCDPRELREDLRAARRESVASERQREADRAQRRPATVRRDG
jgi:hypothetical protein